jgi:hypothetical protein
MRPVSNAYFGEPGAVPDAEVNTHMGNPGLGVPLTHSAEDGGGAHRGRGLDAHAVAPCGESVCAR